MIFVCAISSIVFLSIGYACGWFSHKHKQSRKAVDEGNSCNNEGSRVPQIPGPLYEELQPKATSDHIIVQDLVELKENVAYI